MPVKKLVPMALLSVLILPGVCQKVDADREFDQGSRITITSLTPVQVGNLVTLGRVWGFLKYHHRAVASGRRQWDYDLFRVLPQVLAAPDGAAANAALVWWIDSLGEIGECSGHDCAPPPSGSLHPKPEMDWIRDSSVLGSDLSLRLQRIYKDRPHGSQYYVSLQPMVGNASFDHESDYATIQFPDAGFQLLALYRWWNIMQYWAPYREDAGQDWLTVLAEFIPKLALAKDRNAYVLSLFELVARANDTHANLWNSLDVRPPVGQCALPVSVRFIEDQAVITAIKDRSTNSTFQAGDIIESLDGTSVAKLIEQWTPFYADSNQAARLRDMAGSLTRGPCGPVAVTVRRDEKELSLSPERRPMEKQTGPGTHDLPGDTFRLLSNDVAYLKLSSIKAADVAHDVELAKHTRGFIIDIRNYPSAFMPFALGQFLVKARTSFATFTMPDLANPGAFHFGPAVAIEPCPSHYGGKIVIIVDEVSQSQAEYTAMAMRSAPNAIVVGSTTAGADGNVSPFPLPGGVHTMISGIGIFYPDRRPTQRIGIRTDVEARPSLAGIKAGRDEVLEVAIRQILGPAVSDDELQRLSRPER